MFAEDLVRRGAKVIIADSTVVNVAVRSAVGQIPVVFLSGADPVKLGWVQSLNRPGGTQTGVVMLNTELTQKRAELLAEAAPGLKALGLLGNAANTNIAVHRREMETTARARRLELQIFASRSEVELEAAFRRIAESRPAGMVIQADPWLDSRADQIIAHAAKYETPSIFQWREQTEAGGLISYGVDLRAVYRTIGNMVGRILDGMPPSELPVQQATKIELIVNLRTARVLGLKVAESVLVRADDLIE